MCVRACVHAAVCSSACMPVCVCTCASVFLHTKQPLRHMVHQLKHEVKTRPQYSQGIPQKRSETFVGICASTQSVPGNCGSEFLGWH